MTSENPFLAPARRPRVGVCVESVFPARDAMRLHAGARAAAEERGGEIRSFHSNFTDPSELDEVGRSLLATSQLVPIFRNVDHHDVDAWRAEHPERSAEILGDLARLAEQPVEDLAQDVRLRTATTAMRWIRAWSPDVLFTARPNEQAMYSMITSRTLGVPYVWWLDGWPSGDQPLHSLLPMHLHHASAVVVGQHMVDELCERFGEGVRSKLVVRKHDEEPAAAIGHALDLALERRPESRALGPKSAFSPPPARHAAAPSRCDWFVTLGAERTGSTMLGRLLDSHDGCISGGELFNPRLLDQGTMDWPIHTMREDAGVRSAWEDGSTDVFARLAELEQSEGRKLGFKLLYYHGLQNPGVLRHVLDRAETRVLHIRRRDRLRRWLSHALADRSDRWASDKQTAATKRREDRSIALDPTKTLHDFALQSAYENRYSALFAERELLVTYEDFAADTAGEGSRILNHLDLAEADLTVQTVRAGGRPLADSIENLEELRRVFSGTCWSEHFDQD